MPEASKPALIWTNDHGYIFADSATASEHYPTTVKIADQKCMCAHCKQFITFTKKGRRERHFAHNGWEQDKGCPYRTSPSSTGSNPSNSFQTPWRLSVDEDTSRFSLCLGFLPLPVDLLIAAERTHQQLRVISGDRTLRTLNIDSNNFRTDSISYIELPYGAWDDITLDAADKRIRGIWKKPDPALYPGGTLFSMGSLVSKRLPKYANISVRNDYYLVSKKPLARNSAVFIEYLFTFEKYRVYHVRVDRLSPEASWFFYDYNALLTASGVDLFSLWPATRESGHTVEARSGHSYWLVNGQADFNVYPESTAHTGSISGEPISGQTQDISLFYLNIDKSMSSIWAAQTDVLRYIFIRFQEHNFHATNPTIKVVDENEISVPWGSYETPHGRLIIQSDSSVQIVISLHEEIQAVTAISRDTGYFPIDNIRRGMRISVFAGLDEIGRIDYVQVQPAEVVQTCDLDLLRNCGGRTLLPPARKRWALTRLTERPELLAYYRNAWNQKSMKSEAWNKLLALVDTEA